MAAQRVVLNRQTPVTLATTQRQIIAMPSTRVGTAYPKELLVVSCDVDLTIVAGPGVVDGAAVPTEGAGTWDSTIAAGIVYSLEGCEGLLALAGSGAGTAVIELR